MGLFRLKYQQNDLSNGILEKANRTSINYEKDFENWLENSPHVLFDNEASTVMWIGRQVSASMNENYKYPDLLGIDSDGNVVVVELKRGKTPREVIAQILEYATWAEKLTYDDLNILAVKYYENKLEYKDLNIDEIHKMIFDPENDLERNITYNSRIRLYIVAEEITYTIKEVVKFLNRNGNIDINCLKYEVYKAGENEFYISTELDEAEVFIEKASPQNIRKTTHWNGDNLIRDIVRTAVGEILKLSQDGYFNIKEVLKTVQLLYPDCNVTSIRCQIYSDCVNHTSRKHYKGGQMDYYFSEGKNKYRLYNATKDGVWNSDGLKVSE